MANVLSLASSRNSGADLWVLPNPENGRHTYPLDRSLNFQITKASRHRRHKLSHHLDGILKETEIALSPLKLDDEAPLLIPTQLHLPNRWVLVVPFTDLKSWTRQIHDTWKGLGEPSFRVFLPIGQNAGDFQKIWQTYSGNEDYSLVLE